MQAEVKTERGSIMGDEWYRYLQVTFEGVKYDLRIPLSQYGQGTDEAGVEV